MLTLCNHNKFIGSSFACSIQLCASIATTLTCKKVHHTLRTINLRSPKSVKPRTLESTTINRWRCGRRCRSVVHFLAKEKLNPIQTDETNNISIGRYDIRPAALSVCTKHVIVVMVVRDAFAFCLCV